MNFSDLEELIKTRRSIRKWQDKPVPVSDLLKAVELATWAASGGNQQNWRFYIITNKAKINAMADAVQESANLIASWPEATRFGDAFERSKKTSAFFRSAPAVIAVAASRYQSNADLILEMREKSDPRAKLMREWRNSPASKIQSTSSAVATLLLVLHQMGIGSVWMTGPLQVRGELENIVTMKPEFEMVTVIPVGYPAEKPEIRGRKPVTDVTEVIQ